jgi:hypothetical protein
MRLNVKKLEIRGARELEQLVLENVETVEPGLTAIDSRAVLGESSVDLVGVDGAGALVLLGLGFAAGDAMLLPVLDAYAWCLEYPETVRRLYPIARIDAQWPPRVVFLAERFPDPFLRKLRVLTIPRLQCFEFRYVQVEGALGFYVDPVDWRHRPTPPVHKPADVLPEAAERRAKRPARAEPPPAEPAAPPPVPREPDPSGRPEHDGGDGAQEPATPEENGLARSWRRRQDSTGANDEAKLRAVRDYLQREFPQCAMYDYYDFERAAHVFQLQDSHGKLSHSTAIAADVLAQHTDAAVRALLERHRVGTALRQSGAATVRVSADGLEIERR